MAELLIKVNVDGTSKLDDLKGKLSGVESASSGAEKGIEKVSSQLSQFGTVIKTLAMAKVVKETIEMADTYKLMEARLNLVSKSMNDVSIAQAKLFAMSQNSRSSLETTTALFTKLSMATSDLGKSQAQVLRVTDSVAKALKISGASTEESASAMLQLGQALASGKIQGDELRALSESAPRLYKAIAEGIGVPVGSLKTLGAQGELTADKVFNAIEKMGSKIDSEFTKIPDTVGGSVTRIQNSLLLLTGDVDKAINGTGGLASIFNYFSEAIDNNHKEIIEAGADSLRALQVMGTGILQVGSGIYTFFLGIPTAILATIDVSTGFIESNINSILSSVEKASSKISSLFGGKGVSIGKVDIATNVSDGMMSHYKEMTSFLDNASKTQSKLFKEIMDDTTVIKKNLEGAGGGNGAGGGSPKKELTKEELKAIADLKKAKLDALEQTASYQSEEALSIYQAELDAAQFNYDKESQMAIDLYKAELDAIESNAQRQSDLALEFYGITQSETDKLSEKYLDLYEANKNLFSEEEMQTFFEKWQEQVDGVKGSYESISNEIKNLAPTSKDWTAGLNGQARSIANVLNATFDLSNANKKVADERKKIEKSKDLTKDQKELALSKLKTVELESQYAGYSNLAGAMASAFKQGSDGAIAFTTLQSALGIASSWTAIAEAWALGFPQNIPAVAMVSAAVLPIIQQLGGSGGGGSAKSAPDYSGLIKSASFETGTGVNLKDYSGNFDKFIEGIDSAAQKLEDFGSTGSSSSEKLLALTKTMDDLVKKFVGADLLGVTVTYELSKTMYNYGYEAYKSGVTVGTDIIAYSKAKDEITSIITTSLQDGLDYSRMTKEQLAQITSGIDWVAYNQTLDQINQLALKAKQSGGVISDEDMKTLFDLYTLPNFVNAQDYKDALDAYQKFVDDEKSLLSDRVDSLASFVDSISNAIKDINGSGDTKTTFSDFSTSFTKMMDAITSGSSDLESIGSATITAAKAYLDTVKATATNSYEIAFSKAVITSKLSSAVSPTMATLDDLNYTLMTQLGGDGDIAKRIEAVYDQLTVISDLQWQNLYNNQTGYVPIPYAPTGFASGGYTGNMSESTIAGLVHGKEYVVNAQTTRDLGLNNSAGVFEELLSEIKYLRGLTTTIAGSSVKSLSTQRAMLGEMTA